MRQMIDLPENFLDKIVVDPGTACWHWIGATSGGNRGGYGNVKIHGQNWHAHRAIYIMLVGAIAEGLTLDHLCRLRSCVNPTHLEPVTNTENRRRGHARNQYM